MTQEPNLWNMLAAGCRAIGKGISQFGRLIGAMLRISYRKWWIVAGCCIIAIGAALYLTRAENRLYKVNGIAVINGGNISLVRERMAPLMNIHPQDSTQRVAKLLGLEESMAKNICGFQCYDVIDLLDDGTIDYVDYRSKASRNDTLVQHLQNYVGLQFIIRGDRNIAPAAEQGLMAYLNESAILQSAFTGYREAAAREYQFDRTQIEKLDSLCSTRYYGQQPNTASQTSVVYNQKQEELFLNDIYQAQEKVYQSNLKNAMATAPVVLVNHMVVSRRAIYGRAFSCVAALVLAWIAGCLLALMVEKRQAINAWLKQ